jgi:hypothetical protein
VGPNEALALAQAVGTMPRLRLRGFMGIADADASEHEIRAQFRALRGLLERAVNAGLDADTLSMGMSSDLEAAIAEGATIVRIGTAIFGDRAKTKDGSRHEAKPEAGSANAARTDAGSQDATKAQANACSGSTAKERA